MSIIRKKLKFPCYFCNGKKGKKCKLCHGTRSFEEEVNYFIDDKKKIAIDGDNLK